MSSLELGMGTLRESQRPYLKPRTGDVSLLIALTTQARGQHQWASAIWARRTLSGFSSSTGHNEQELTPTLC